MYAVGVNITNSVVSSRDLSKYGSLQILGFQVGVAGQTYRSVHPISLVNQVYALRMLCKSSVLNL